MAGRFSVETVFKGVDRITGVMAKIQAKSLSMTKSITKNIDQMNKHVSAVSDGMVKAGTAIGVAGVAAGAGLLWAGKAGADFEQAITRVGSKSFMTRDQIADLEKKAMDLGRTTKFTATEAANAMEVMAVAGFNNAEILSGVGGILAAAAAEGTEMAEVASHVSNVLKGMGLAASDAGRVADVLTLASARTNSSISSLGESMKNLSPVARQFGVSLEDAVGMVALLQDVGLDASEAGTATATMMAKLAKPSKEAAAQMKALGVEFKDAKGNMLPMTDVFNQMKNASGKLPGNMDKVAFFAELVGLRGQKAALNLQDLFTSDKGQKLTEELRHAEGAAQRMADLSMANLLGDLTLLESAVDGVKVALFNTESGALRGVVKGMTDWVTANQALIVSGFTEFMTGVRDALPTIVTWLGRIGKALVVFYTFAAAVKAINVAMVVWNALMAANPIVLLVYAIVAAIALIWAFWPEISAFFKMVWAGIVSLAKMVGGALSAFFTGLWSTIKPFVMGLVNYVVGLATLLAQPFILVFKGLVIIAQLAWAGMVAVFDAAAPYFSAIWNGISAAFSLVWDGIVAIASAYYELFTAVWSPIGEFFSGLWGGIASAFEAALGWVMGKIEWLAEKAGWIVDKISGVGADALGGKVDLTDGMAGAGRNMVAPRSTSTDTTTTSKSEVTVKAAPGAVATQTKGRRNVGLRLQPTGAF